MGTKGIKSVVCRGMEYPSGFPAAMAPPGSTPATASGKDFLRLSAIAAPTGNLGLGGGAFKPAQQAQKAVQNGPGMGRAAGNV